MLYLASSSPRRAELLRQIGVEFTILKVDIDELPLENEPACQLVCRLSREKAREARRQLKSMQPGDLILAADTVINLNGMVMGKPETHAHCCSMLETLSGRQHQVLSAITLINWRGEIKQSCTQNEITFKKLAFAEIDEYCRSGEPMDKAGAYAIQGRAAMFIRRLEGSYSSVMGLPLFETAQLLQQEGYDLNLTNKTHHEN